MTIEFFLPMILPTTTHQQKKVNIKNNKPIFYEPPALADARAKFMAHLHPHTPQKPFVGAIRLVTKWCYKTNAKNKDGEYKITRPDTDNIIKLLKDVMTKLGFWIDDEQVACEITEKFWAKVPGLYVKIESIGGEK